MTAIFLQPEELPARLSVRVDVQERRWSGPYEYRVENIHMASMRLRGKVWVATIKLNGKWATKSLHTRDKREAQAEYEKLVGDARRGTLKMPSMTKLDEFFKSYCTYMSLIHARTTYRVKAVLFRDIFGPRCPELAYKRQRQDGCTQSIAPIETRFLNVQTLEEITSEDCWELLQFYRKNRAGAKWTNVVRGHLGSLFTYARKYRKYRCPEPDRRDPLQGLERFEEEPFDIVFLTNEQIDEQLAVLEGNSMLHTLVATYIYAGLRREEACWLTMNDIELFPQGSSEVNGFIHIRAKRANGESWRSKTKKDRVIPIGDKLYDKLSVYLKTHKGPWVFSENGNRLSPDRISCLLEWINSWHGLGWTPGKFRHTFGSHMAQHNVSLFKISELMGNSPEVCRKHYAKLTPTSMATAVNFVNCSFAPPKTSGSHDDSPNAQTFYNGFTRSA